MPIIQDSEGESRRITNSRSPLTIQRVKASLGYRRTCLQKQTKSNQMEERSQLIQWMAKSATWMRIFSSMDKNKIHILKNKIHLGRENLYQIKTKWHASSVG